MSKKKKPTSLDITFETSAYLETLSDDELLKRARAKVLKEKGQMDVGQPVVLLGTDEYSVILKRREERERRKATRSNFVGRFFDGVRFVVFTPLCSVFNLLSFVAEIVGKISSLGLLVAVYFIYQGVREVMDGVAFGEVEAFMDAVPFLIFPFIALAISKVCDATYKWMRKQTR